MLKRFSDPTLPAPPPKLLRRGVKQIGCRWDLYSVLNRATAGGGTQPQPPASRGYRNQDFFGRKFHGSGRRRRGASSRLQAVRWQKAGGGGSKRAAGAGSAGVPPPRARSGHGQRVPVVPVIIAWPIIIIFRCLLTRGSPMGRQEACADCARIICPR